MIGKKINAHVIARATARSNLRQRWESLQVDFHRPHIVILLFLLSSFLLFSCSTNTPQPTPQIVSVYSSSAAQPWLTELYACGPPSVVISRVDDASVADISLRVGEPEILALPAY